MFQPTIRIERYADETRFDTFESAFGNEDTLGDVVNEILALGLIVQVDNPDTGILEPFNLDQIEVAQPDGTTEVVWVNGPGYGGGNRTAADTMNNVLPLLDTQRLLGIIRVFYSAMPVQVEENQIGCNMCGRRSSFRCKRCKRAHYCSKKCHRRHKHHCY